MKNIYAFRGHKVSEGKEGMRLNMKKNELDDIIKNYNKSIKLFKAICDDINSKEIEQITKDDINKYMMQKKTIYYYLRKINYIKESLIKKQNEIKANLEKYNLVERSAVVNEEEEKQINEDLEKIENVDDEIFNELTTQTDAKIKKVISIMQMKRKEQKRQQVKEHLKEIEKFIKQPSDPTGMIMHIEDDIHSRGHILEKSDKVVAEKVQTLVRKYLAYDKNERMAIGHYEHADRVISFKSYKECELEEKQKIREYEQRVTEILTSEDERFDIPGRIRIPVYMGRALERYDYDFIKDEYTWPGMIYLDMAATPRELAEAGIDYKDFNWKSIEQIKEEQKTRITPKTISKITSNLPIRAIKHVKELFFKRKDNRNDER